MRRPFRLPIMAVQKYVLEMRISSIKKALNLAIHEKKSMKGIKKKHTVESRESFTLARQSRIIEVGNCGSNPRGSRTKSKASIVILVDLAKGREFLVFLAFHGGQDSDGCRGNSQRCELYWQSCQCGLGLVNYQSHTEWGSYAYQSELCSLLVAGALEGWGSIRRKLGCRATMAMTDSHVKTPNSASGVAGRELVTVSRP
ncbi:hypothetical protein BDZ91DRAFT_784786 [Kalaharituber pfeilii]|nr:hypothetical protein BDZ91DRAFT_784786 [Kalaharituber pfeilii]